MFTALVLAIILILQTNSVCGQWTRMADALRKRGECVNVLYNGKLFIFGGFGQHPQIESSNEVYDPVSDHWAFIDSTPPGKRLHIRELF